MNYLRVGLITRPHGVHGDVKVIPLTDNPERFRDLKEAFIENNGAYEARFGEQCQGIQPDAAFVHAFMPPSLD